MTAGTRPGAVGPRRQGRAWTGPRASHRAGQVTPCRERPRASQLCGPQLAAPREAPSRARKTAAALQHGHWPQGRRRRREHAPWHGPLPSPQQHYPWAHRAVLDQQQVGGHLGDARHKADHEVLRTPRHDLERLGQQRPADRVKHDVGACGRAGAGAVAGARRREWLGAGGARGLGCRAAMGGGGPPSARKVCGRQPSAQKTPLGPRADAPTLRRRRLDELVQRRARRRRRGVDDRVGAQAPQVVRLGGA
jgi:hypothetical protein